MVAMDTAAAVGERALQLAPSGDCQVASCVSGRSLWQPCAYSGSATEASSGIQQFDFERAEIAILSSWRISVRLEAYCSVG